MSLYLGNKPISSDGSSRLTGEIGDMGFAPLGIDESLNLRRYLNGQIISQIQFVAFTTKVKSAVALSPSLATTEDNWQAEKALSKFGQVGKFVIDDENQTIRLPAVVNAQGLLDLTGIGNLVNESLPNITGNFSMPKAEGNVSGSFYKIQQGEWNAGNANTNGWLVGFDASLSSTAYQTNAPVQQEAIQYPYYIQVATGIEETLPAIREYKVNNSDYFGKSIYSDVDPNNASWLLSNDQWNSKSVYPDYYDWLVSSLGKDHIKGMIGYAFKKPNEEVRWWTAKRNPEIGDVVFGGLGIQKIGVVNKVNSDGTIGFYEADYSIQQDNLTYTESENINVDGTGFDNLVWANDYDFVINTTDETFRLPLLNGERVLVAKKEPTNGNYDWYNLYSDGWCEQGGAYTFTNVTTSPQYVTIGLLKTMNFYSVNICPRGPLSGDWGAGNYVIEGTSSNSFNLGAYSFRNVINTVTIDWSACGYTSIPTQTDYTEIKGLYYYVGDVVQDASLINAGGVLNDIADLKRNKLGREGNHTVVETYKNGMNWYRVWSDGWCEQGGYSAGGAYIVTFLKQYIDTSYTALATFEGSYSSNSIAIVTRTNTGFHLNRGTAATDIGGKFWRAEGYIR